MRLPKSRLSLTFGVSFVVLMVFWVVMGSGVQGFDLFNLWTVKQNIKVGSTYVAPDSVDESAMGTVLAQVGLGNGSYQTSATLDGVFRVLQTSEALVSADIVALLVESEDRQATLDAHLATIQATRFEITEIAADYQTQAAVYLTESNACLADKQEGDRLFFEGVNTSDSGLAEAGLESSVEAGPCYMTNRIRANAMAYLSARVQLYAGLLAQREQILTTNQQSLVDHAELLQGTLLEELLSVKYQLNQLQATPYSTVQGTFGTFTGIGSATLPNYFEVFFPGARPTYLSPQLTLTPEGTNY